MAAPYYKYEPRDAENQVNWAEISGQITKTLDEKRTAVVAGTALADKEYQDYMQSLNNVAVADNPSFNNWTNGMTSDLQEAKLLLYRQLQRGEINLREYTFYNNNLSRGTDSFLTVSSSIAEWIQKNNELRASGQMSALGEWNAAKIESFMNLAQTSAYINPKDFTMGVAGLEFDETTGGWKVSSNPGKVTSFEALVAGMKQTYGTFDVTADVQRFVGTFGQDIRVKMDALGYTSIEDVRRKTGKTAADQELINIYDKAKENAISAMMANPEMSAYILTNMKVTAPNGDQYEITDNPDGIKPHQILVTYDPTTGRQKVQLSPDQISTVKEQLSIEIERQLTYKEDYTQLRQAPPPQPRDLSAEEQRAQADVRNFAYLYGGTPDQFRAAVEHFRTKDPTISNIEKSGGQLVVTYTNKPPQPINLQDGTTGVIPFEQAISAAQPIIQNQLALNYVQPYATQQYSVPTSGSYTGTQRMLNVLPPSQIPVGALDPESAKFLPTGTDVSSGVAGAIKSSDETDAANQAAQAISYVFRRALQNETQANAAVRVVPHNRDSYKLPSGEKLPDDFVEINAPGITDGSIFIPMTTDSGNWGGDKRKIGDITAAIIDIYNRNKGRPVTFEDLKPFYMAKDNDGNDPRVSYSPERVIGFMRGQQPAAASSPSAPLDYGTK